MESIIFRTLLHSLWQGVLLAVLAALIVSLTTRVNAKLRYNLFVGCLVIFIAGVGTTFFIELNNSIPSAGLHTMWLGSPALGDTVMQPGATETIAGSSPIVGLVRYVNEYSSSIVLVWFLIICVKSIRFMVDMRTLVQIRTSQVYHSGTMLTEKVQYLARQYGIKQKIQILQSGIIKVPMVLGHFKPLILVPLGLINGLSMEEVDAILSHEMAHIKRRDYLVNILQSAAEILFFFNPAVLWVSNMIRTEREHCCDDLAVTNVKTKTDYIKALVSCQEFAAVTPSYVMAINGGKSHLVHRVQRLISSRNQSLNKLEKVIIALVLISAVVITTAFSGKDIKVAAIVTQEKNAVPVKIKDNSDAIYNQLIKEGLAKSNAGLYCTLDKDDFVINGKKQSAVIHAKYAQKYLEKGQRLSYRFEKDYKKNSVSAMVVPVRKTDQVIQKPVQVRKAMARVANSQQEALADKKIAQKNATEAQAATTNNQKVIVEKVTAKNDMTVDLIADVLIENKLNLSYHLDSDELVVDGKKQPDAVHKKYSRKYLKTANQKISVTVSTN